MTEESDRMLILLQELAMIKDAEKRTGKMNSAHRRRRKEIRDEIKQIAAEKRNAEA